MTMNIDAFTQVTVSGLLAVIVDWIAHFARNEPDDHDSACPTVIHFRLGASFVTILQSHGWKRRSLMKLDDKPTEMCAYYSKSKDGLELFSFQEVRRLSRKSYDRCCRHRSSERSFDVGANEDFIKRVLMGVGTRKRLSSRRACGDC